MSSKRLKKGLVVNVSEWEQSAVVDSFQPIVDALRKDTDLQHAGVAVMDLDAVTLSRTVAQLIQLHDELFGRKGEKLRSANALS
jgi:hypothetical protein